MIEELSELLQCLAFWISKLESRHAGLDGFLESGDQITSGELDFIGWGNVGSSKIFLGKER